MHDVAVVSQEEGDPQAMQARCPRPREPSDGVRKLAPDTAGNMRRLQGAVKKSTQTASGRHAFLAVRYWGGDTSEARVVGVVTTGAREAVQLR